jgi:hypothetical protein
MKRGKELVIKESGLNKKVGFLMTIAYSFQTSHFFAEVSLRAV